MIFKDRRTSTEHYESRFKPKSTLNPPKIDPLLESYLSLLEKNLLSI